MAKIKDIEVAGQCEDCNVEAYFKLGNAETIVSPTSVEYHKLLRCKECGLLNDYMGIYELEWSL